ncbi:MAG: DUF3048 domain-containing protein [Candidatus Levybacteria bacterium]|nr:DUF3048 domain-containing protein [Candidatus Levybacteria bacterium]
MSKNKLLSFGLVIVIYLISTLSSYMFFSGNTKASESAIALPTTGASGQLEFDQGLPKTEECPLNGVLYSKQQRSWWEKQRPLGVMIENHSEARPQSGLSSADVVYEAVAEGGITRFLSVFYCQAGGPVGPVRSARTYFLDWISEYGQNPLYAHVGGANCNAETGSGCLNGAKADAMGQIEDYGWASYNDLSQFNLSYPTFKRVERPNGRDVATEHTMFSSTEELWKVAAKRKLTNVNEDGELWDESFVKYSFKEDAPKSQRPSSQSIHLEFWTRDSDYHVDWIYDPITNLYKRNNGGVAHFDRNNKQQLTAKNIVVLSMVESSANDGYDNNVHLLYRNKGTGKANVFMDGKQIVGTWKKDSRTARTLLFDNKGLPIKFDRGSIWFEILPTDGVLTVK